MYQQCIYFVKQAKDVVRIMDEYQKQLLEDIKDTHAEILKLLAPKPPLDQIYYTSASKGFELDYKERKHIYFWLPTSALTLTFEDYGSGVVQAQVWTNIGFPQGINVLAPNNSSQTPVFVRCTDEVIP